MFSETPDIISISSHHRIEVLSADELAALQNGTLQILSEVGVYFPSEKALSIFSDHGAQVDWETRIVRIPPDLVRKAMSTAPRSFVLGGREERFDLLLDGSASYLATDGCGVHVIDLETREKRASRKADVAMMARISDALPMVSFFWPLVSAQRETRLPQSRCRHDGPHQRCPAHGQLLLAVGKRPGLWEDSSPARMPRRPDEYLEACARRHHCTPQAGACNCRHGDRGRRE